MSFFFNDPSTTEIYTLSLHDALPIFRDINRQIVLNYVREREPISRADIARETALQRSTVSIIVEELKEEGLIEEVGDRKSTRLNSSHANISYAVFCLKKKKKSFPPHS